MTRYLRVSPAVTIIANQGTLYVSWPDGQTTTEEDQEAGAVVRAATRPCSEDELRRTFDHGLVARLTEQELLVPCAPGGAPALHRATLRGPDASIPTVAHDDARLVREYGTERSRPLPVPRTVDVGLTAALEGRSSARHFTSSPLGLDTLSTWFSAATGTHPRDPRWPRVVGAPPPRLAYPSPGALYPVELSLLAWNVTGLEPGAYRYQPFGHRIAFTTPTPPHVAAELVPDHPAETAAALLVLWCDLLSPVFDKYGAKGYRLTLLEAGHIMQNLVLLATALDIPTLPVAGFRDEDLATSLGLEGEQVPLYGLLTGGGPR